MFLMWRFMEGNVGTSVFPGEGHFMHLVFLRRFLRVFKKCFSGCRLLGSKLMSIKL